MKKLALSLVSLVCIASSASAREGGYVGNGGNTVECRPSAANPLVGEYSLDYLVTLRDPSGDRDVREVASWEASAARIERLLRAKVPEIADSFSRFANGIFRVDYLRDQVWEPAPFGLVKIDDQKLVALLPDNCRAGDVANLSQAVVREYRSFSGSAPGHVVFRYDSKRLEALRRRAPLQFSFLMVHEWLWELSANIDRNRRVDRFLHSSEWETMTPDEVRSALTAMGLVLPGATQDAFSPDACQGYPITEEAFRARYPRPSMLFSVGALETHRRTRIVDCRGSGRCSSEWREPPMPPGVLAEKAFLTFSWAIGIDPAPIKILFPKFVASKGGVVAAGSGQFKCRFVPDREENLDCEIDAPEFVFPLYFTSGFELARAEWPHVRGRFTEECVRFRAVGFATMETWNGETGSGRELHEIETVFTRRLTW